MSAPNPTLLSIYGTGSTYLEKQAGLASLAGRVGLALVAMKAIDSYHQNLVAQQVASEQRAHLERRNPEMDDVIMRMRYSHPPIMVAPLTPRSQEQIETEYGLGVMPGAPVGMDSGMVRLAMVGENVGKLMAKKAALAPTVAPGVLQQVGQRVKNVARQAANKLPGAVPKGATGTIAAAPVPAAFTPHVHVHGSPDAGAPNLATKALAAGTAGLGAYALYQGAKKALSPEESVVKAAGIGGAALGALSLPGKAVSAVGSLVGKVVDKTKPLQYAPVVGKKGIGQLGWKGKALGLGAAGLGAYGIAKGTQAATGWGSEEAAPTNWSHTDYGAPQLVKNVNEFGYT